MDTINAFGFKQKKYMPVFPKANGKTTVYIEGYPCEDAEARAETAEARVEEEVLRRQQVEAELEKLRAQIAKSQR